MANSSDLETTATTERRKRRRGLIASAIKRLVTVGVGTPQMLSTPAPYQHTSMGDRPDPVSQEPSYAAAPPQSPGKSASPLAGKPTTTVQTSKAAGTQTTISKSADGSTVHATINPIPKPPTRSQPRKLITGPATNFKKK